MPRDAEFAIGPIFTNRLRLINPSTKLTIDMLQREAAVTRDLGTRMGILTRSDGSGRFAFGML